MGDYETKGNESEVSLDIQQAHIRALNCMRR
jgi:hypothetical protein